MKKPQKVNDSKKAIDYNTELIELSKDCTYINYLSEKANLLYPEKDNWRKRLCYTMLLWSENKDALEIEQFCIQYKIPRRTLYFWRKYDDIRQVMDDVKLILASRRRVGAMNNKLNGTFAYKDMHKLDPEWESVDKYHAKLKEDNNSISPEEAQKIVQSVLQDFNKKDK